MNSVLDAIISNLFPFVLVTFFRLFAASFSKRSEMKYITLLFFSFFLLISLSLQAQKVTVSGSVKDDQSGEDLPGVTVLVKELPGTGAYSNEYGFYSISVPPGNYTLVYRYLSYETQEVKVDLTENKKINIELFEVGAQLDDVLITDVAANENVSANEMSVVKLDPKAIESIPVLFGEKDVLKTLQLFPGVQAAGEGSSGINVRGGGSDQNLILLDEAAVYNASHLLGFFSVFNSDAIRDLELYKGGLPAQFGGRLSSVMNVRMKEGNLKKYEVNGGIGLISSRLTVQGPIAKDKASFIVSGRRTYADLFLKFAPDTSLRNNQLYFYDINAKVNWKLGENDRLFLSGYFGRDKFGFGDAFSFGWGNATGTLRWNHIFGSKLFSNTSFVFSSYNYEFAIGAAGFAIKSAIQDLNLKQDYQLNISQNNKLRFGFDAVYHTFIPQDIEADEDSGVNIAPAEKKYAVEAAVYIANEQKIGSRLTMEYGIRLSNFAAIGPGNFFEYDENGNPIDTVNYGTGELVRNYINPEPRFQATFLINEKNSIKAAYSRTNQYVHLLSNSTSTSPTDLWVPSSNIIKPQGSDQIAAGYFTNLFDNNLEISVEGYYKWMRNVVDYRTGADVSFNNMIEADLVFGIGRAYGAEFLVRKTFGKFTGWVSYTLSRTERKFDAIDQGSWFPARQDRTHDVSVVLLYKFNERFDISTTWVYYTGNATTFPSGRYNFAGNTVSYYTERNGYRMPDYHRLDLGFNYNSRKFKIKVDPETGQEKKVKKKLLSSLNVSVYNAYARENAFTITFQDSETNPGQTEAVKLALFKIIPSITYNFSF